MIKNIETKGRILRLKYLQSMGTDVHFIISKFMNLRILSFNFNSEIISYCKRLFHLDLWTEILITLYTYHYKIN